MPKSTSKRTCSEDGCNKPVVGRMLCNNHYHYRRRHGTLPPLPVRGVPFWDRVDKSGDCWLWTGGLDVHGYGIAWQDGKHNKAHRYAWTLSRGPVPNGKQLDHLCHTRNCVNPDHMRVTTAKQNIENHSGAKRHNKLGVRGVWVSSKNGKYNAKVTHNYKPYWLGEFDTLEEAEAVVIAKRNELYTHNNHDRKAA